MANAEVEEEQVLAEASNSIDGYIGGNRTQGSTNNNYSLEEQVIGTWIDGKPIYRRTLTSEVTTDIDISDFATTIDKVTAIYGTITHTTSNNNQAPVPYYFNSNDYCYPYFNATTQTITILKGSYSGPITLSIEYTKTTDITESN